MGTDTAIRESTQNISFSFFSFALCLWSITIYQKIYNVSLSHSQIYS